MAILRLSSVKSVLYATSARGELVHEKYSAAKAEGGLGTYVRPPEDAKGMVPEGDAFSPKIRQHFDAIWPRVTKNLKPTAPVVVLVHGFLFDPRIAWSPNPADSDNPHCRIYHFADLGMQSEIREHTTGWPLQLGFREDDGGKEGLALAFGWHSQPGFARSLMERFQNFYARAYDNAHETAWSLVCVLHSLAAKLPASQPIDIFCHSLGSSVVVRALAMAAKYRYGLVHRIGRVVILGGSEYTGEANLLYSRLLECDAHFKRAPSEPPHVYNIVSRENDVLDKLGENFGPKSFFSTTQVIGHNGLEARKGAPKWMDIQIDGGPMREWMAKHRDVAISGDDPGSIWDHWYYYTHRGNMALYRNILRDRPSWDFPLLRKATKTQKAIPEGVALGFFGD